MNLLTPNAIRQMYESRNKEQTVVKPVVQVINIRNVPPQNPGEPDRYR
jgi:hypothetical protein